MYIHSNIFILRFMHVHGRRYIVYTFAIYTRQYIINGYAYCWSVSGKKKIVGYRIRNQIRLLTKKLLSLTKRKKEPYFLKNIFSYRKPKPSEGQKSRIQIKPPKISASERTMSKFLCIMIFDMKSIFADNRGQSCLCKDRQEL